MINGSFTLHGTGNGNGAGNNGFLYYAMYCIHYTKTGNGTGNGNGDQWVPYPFPIPGPGPVEWEQAIRNVQHQEIFNQIGRH